ncbi:MAG: response regulator [Prolixibacteraceae bacterium]|nr:response regulator [Prolixibacteraceae bacterium]
MMVEANTGSTAKPIPTINPLVSSTITNQQITSFAEDEFGFIWISTIRGLNKFNIFEYHQYFHSSDSTSISDNRIQSLYKDSGNRLWVATVNGICRYNKQDAFERVRINSLSNNAIRFFENREGKLFLSMNFEICVYNEQEDCFDPVIKNLDFKNSLTQCFVDDSNNIWTVTPEEIRCTNSQNFEVLQSFQPRHYNTFSYLNERGELWLSSWNQLEIYHIHSGKYLTVPASISNHPVLSESIISGMFPYNATSVIIRTQRDGLFLYNYLNNAVIHQSENGFPFEVPDFEISTIYTDTKKNIWIGSSDQGYTVRYHYKERFNNNNYLRSKFENISVSNVTADKQHNLWFATRSNGITIYRHTDHQFQTFSNEEVYSFWRSNFLHKTKKLFVDQENNLWILSDWMLLKTRYTGQKIEMLKYFYFPGGILSIHQDGAGTIWLGGSNESIYTLKKGESEFQPFHLYGKEFTFTPCILPLSSGQIMVASFGHELQLIDPESWDVSTIPITKHIHNSRFIPTCLFEDSYGDIWIGTITNGIYRYSRTSETISQFEGTACTDISSITEDISGNIWIGTLDGLSKYDRTNNQFINYSQNDGIGGNQFNEQSVCRLPDHTMIFGGTHGLTFFNPLDISYKRNISLLFQHLKINNQLEHPATSKSIDKHLVYHPDILLKHHQNSFSISFVALDYCEFERVKYAYKLEGYDRMWIEANNNHDAYYSNIPSGKYNFIVKIYNSEKTISETENSIKIRIQRAPWVSWPALVLYLIVFELLLVFLIKMQRRIKTNKDLALQAEREKEQEQRVNKMNMSFFANLSHEFRTPLTMISGPVSTLCNDSTIKGNSKQLLYIVQRNVNRMLRLVNQLMDFNKLENDTLKLEVKLADIIAELLKSIEIFEMNAKEKGISLNTYGLEDSFIMWLDPDKLEKIITNLMANALKFSIPGGNIGVSFDVITRQKATQLFPQVKAISVEQWVKITVTNTGKGIPEDKLEKIFERYYQLDHQTHELYNWGTGIGLYFARSLTELHHGYIKAGNLENGVSFTLILPASEEVYPLVERESHPDNQHAIFTSKLPEKITYHDDKPGAAQKPRIMVIDDDSEVIHYLKALLTGTYQVLARFDADSAFKSIKEFEPDLILCDVLMPGTDGFQFCRMLKESPSFCHIPCVLVTAKATVENQVEGLNSGADAYVSKPFDPSYLMALINSQLSNREKLRNLLGTLTRTENIDENILLPQDKVFMSGLYELMENELSNTELNITRMTEVLRISRTKFYYKVKSLTGENPNVFFKTYKLNRAAELLREGKYNISEIADMTGFSTLSHFSVSFKKQFGHNPSGFR